MLAYNKVCNIEDFDDSRLKQIIRDIYAHELALFPPEYPNGVADSKQWEIAMAVRTLADFGCLEGSRILGVGAGTEITSFYLTRHASEVVATDIYANAHVWADVAPLQFLVDPGRFSPIEYRHDRLVPLHMDARSLRFPSNSFDGVYSSGSIEHFGSLEAVANAAYEIGRVLRPGGIATIATEFKLAGPPDGDGWDPNVILFSPEKLKHFIVEASGLEPVDALDIETSTETLAIRRDLRQFLEGTRGDFDPQKKIANYPNLVLYYEGYLFCSVHLALRKPERTKGDNAWAAPSAATRLEATRGVETAAAGRTLLSMLRDATQGAEELAALKDRVDVLSREWERLTADVRYRDERVVDLSGQIAELQHLLTEARGQNATLSVQVADLAKAFHAEKQKSEDLENSLSWRVTKPLRALYGLLPGH